MATIYPPRRQVDDLRQPLAIDDLDAPVPHPPGARHRAPGVPAALDDDLFLSEIVQRSTRFYIVAKARR